MMKTYRLTFKYTINLSSKVLRFIRRTTLSNYHIQQVQKKHPVIQDLIGQNVLKILQWLHELHSSEQRVEIFACEVSVTVDAAIA